MSVSITACYSLRGMDVTVSSHQTFLATRKLLHGIGQQVAGMPLFIPLSL